MANLLTLVTRRSFSGMALALLVASAGCAGGSSTSPPAPSVPRNLYVANRDGSSVLTFPVAGPFGNVAPSTAIGGANTQLVFPDGLAVDGFGTIYVGENDTSNASVIAGFLAGANGNAAPAFSFTPSPALRVEGVVVDASGNVYVSSWIGSVIDVFPPAPSGSVAPSRVISGANTLLSGPDGMALGSGHLYVADFLNNAIDVFPANANGNVAPVSAIAGTATLLNHPGEIALDSTGRILVANAGTGGKGSILIFANGAAGNAAPVATIGGTNTGILDPSGVARSMARERSGSRMLPRTRSIDSLRMPTATSRRRRASPARQPPFPVLSRSRFTDRRAAGKRGLRSNLAPFNRKERPWRA